MSDRSVSVMTGAAFKLLLVGGGEAETSAAAGGGGGAGGGDLMTVELSRLGTHLQAALGRHAHVMRGSECNLCFVNSDDVEEG